MSKWKFVGAWVLVAALATTLTWQIVSAADAQVSDSPPIQATPAPSTSDSTASMAPTPRRLQQQHDLDEHRPVVLIDNQWLVVDHGPIRAPCWPGLPGRSRPEVGSWS